jgi:succinate-acetate transporter protein
MTYESRIPTEAISPWEHWFSIYEEVYAKTQSTSSSIHFSPLNCQKWTIYDIVCHNTQYLVKRCALFVIFSFYCLEFTLLCIENSHHTDLFQA